MISKVVLLGMLAVLAGCASPPSQDTPAQVATADPPAVQTPTADPQPAMPSTPASADGEAPPGPPPGWSEKKRAGKVVHCKTVEVTGSHFPQEVCLEPKQLQAILRQQKKQAERTLDIPTTN